ncbi:hypothetical protein Bca101_038597 [Brassica carinata]
MAEQRYAVFSSREIIAEQVIDLKAEDTWGALEVIKKRHLEKIVTGLVGYMLEVIREFYAGSRKKRKSGTANSSKTTSTSHASSSAPAKAHVSFASARSPDQHSVPPQGVPNPAGKFHLIQLGTAVAP